MLRWAYRRDEPLPYAFLDKTGEQCGKTVVPNISNSLPVPEDAGNFDKNYLYTLARLYDTAVLGNAYDPDRRLARRTSFMYDYSRTPRSAPTTIDSAASAAVVRYVAERIDIWQSAATERYIA